MGYQSRGSSELNKMKAFLCVTTALVSAVCGAPGLLSQGLVGHAPLLARPAGQVTHQSVSKPFQGEHRSTTQSKAFGAGVAAVADAPNRLHGARALHGIAHPVVHAVARPVAVAHAPVIAHAPVLAHPVVAHAALSTLMSLTHIPTPTLSMMTTLAHALMPLNLLTELAVSPDLTLLLFLMAVPSM